MENIHYKAVELFGEYALINIRLGLLPFKYDNFKECDCNA